MVQIGKHEIDNGVLIVLLIIIIGVAILTYGAIICNGATCLYR